MTDGSGPCRICVPGTRAARYTHHHHRDTRRASGYWPNRRLGELGSWALETLGMGTLRAGKHFLGPGAHQIQADAGCCRVAMLFVRRPPSLWPLVQSFSGKLDGENIRRRQQKRHWGQRKCRGRVSLSRRLTRRTGPLTLLAPPVPSSPSSALSFCSAAKPHRERPSGVYVKEGGPTGGRIR